jgi:starch-binding outer membrane protein, SusD/RagB family
MPVCKLFPLMMLLMYAEVSNRAEAGTNADAISYVNMIRQRANLPAITSMSQDAFEKEVWT